jgi:hypothetical protein
MSGFEQLHALVTQQQHETRTRAAKHRRWIPARVPRDDPVPGRRG